MRRLPVGIAGLTLGGGLGALMPKYGVACDNQLSAHVVTVDGRQVEASQNSNSDLFWAIRGGGGNFGVATSLEYRLRLVSEDLAGALMYPAGRIPELLQAYAKFTAAMFYGIPRRHCCTTALESLQTLLHAIGSNKRFRR